MSGNDQPGYAHILEHLVTSVVLLDRDFKVCELNPAAENLLQISRDHLRGQPLTRYVHDADALRELLDSARHASRGYLSELVLRRGEDARDPVYIDCRVAPYTGNADGWLIVEFSDVTKRVRVSRDNQLRSQHDTGRMIIRQLAHEIKNPLGGLRGAAQLLGRHLDDPELTGYTAVIINEVDRLAALVDSLLGPGGSINKSDVNLHDVLEHVIRLVDADRVVNVRWQRDYDPSLPTLMLDRDQMIQAVLNIVRNAIAASDGADVELSLRTRALTNDTIGAVPHRVIASIEIADNGPGIDPEIRDSIFYPLVTGRPDGTGLGLPLSQELIQRHGGLIEFTSEPGHTVFQIRLPMESSS
ncbi:MAG: nitrogen regulation protein NR(II) [Pseudomonadota bacterium]